jgi:Family of unknown function (DUF6288)
MESAKGQSAVGSWGHSFAEPSGRLTGYGMMNSPGIGGSAASSHSSKKTPSPTSYAAFVIILPLLISQILIRGAMFRISFRGKTPKKKGAKTEALGVRSEVDDGGEDWWPRCLGKKIGQC